MSDRVFEDRLGLWVISPANVGARLAPIKAFRGGIIRDLFLPRNAEVANLAQVRQAGLFAHLWVTPDDLTAEAYANRTLDDVNRLRPGAVELNVELPNDPPLTAYIREVVERIRARRPSLRLRVNVAPWKAFALPIDLLRSDGVLYACEQNYEGNMDNLLSPADVLYDLQAWGVPSSKATVCYAAACQVLGSSSRLRTLPDLARLRRGVIFSDDLMADAGLL
jgi:hypothetical protein